jgi:3-oxoadipate enol-lactonase
MGKASFIPVNAGRLYYERVGHGQPLVLLHSGGLHCGEWDDQFAVFGMSYLVVRYDRRGYGRSQMPKQEFSHVQDLHAVLTSLQLVKPVLLGFSAGGGIALDFVLTYPDMVRALILVGPSLSGYRGSPDRQQELQPLWDAMNHGTIDDVVEAWMKDPAVAPVPENFTARQRMQDLIRDNAQWLLRHPGFSLALSPPALDRLMTVTVPTLVIAGERDASDNLHIVRIISDAIPRAESVIIARAGHHVNLEQPLEFNRTVLDFLSHQRFTDHQSWGTHEKL